MDSKHQTPEERDRVPLDPEAPLARPEVPREPLEEAPTAALEPSPGSHRTPTDLDRARARIDALLELLRDDSPSVLRAVREELLAADRLADAPLQRAAQDADPRLRVRARAVLALRERGWTMRRLFGYARKDAIDLERALFLLGRLDRADLDSRPYEKALDAMAAEVRERAAREADPFARPMVLSQFLGNELGFIGSEADLTHPDNIHLHRAIERKTGLPLTLTAIYLFVARRAGIAAAPVALPGRVLLRLYAGKRALLIDPFQGGRARTRSDCIRYLARHGLVPRPDWFHDATDRQLFQRHVLNLMASAQNRGRTQETAELHRLALEIARGPHAGGEHARA